MSKLQSIIKKHGIMLLNIYGVKEKKIKEYPEALNGFIDALRRDVIKMRVEILTEKYEKNNKKN